MIYAINYANELYETERKFNTKTAYSKGRVDVVIEYSPNDIEEAFREKNKKILAYKRGAGLWLWKPYIILKTLRQINESDYLFYCDAGAFYVNRIQLLIDCMEKNNQTVMTFELPLLARQFTKKETFHLMNYANYEQNQVLASYLLLKKCAFSEQLICEWLEYCCDERIISPRYFRPDIAEFDDFVEHREDQSILSIVVKKHNLPVFRDPSNYGDRPWEYASKNWLYVPKEYPNSIYCKVLVSNRKNNPLLYRYKEKFKTVLNKLGLYTQSYYFKKHGINENLE